MKNKIFSSLAGLALLINLFSFVAYAEDAGVPIEDNEAPSFVTGVAATAGDSEVTLTWNATTDNIGVTGYVIDYGLESVAEFGDTYTDTIDVGNVLEHTIEELVNDETYYFAIYAYDASGNESLNWSVEVSATPEAEVVEEVVEEEPEEEEEAGEEEVGDEVSVEEEDGEEEDGEEGTEEEGAEDEDASDEESDVEGEERTDEEELSEDEDDSEDEYDSTGAEDVEDSEYYDSESVVEIEGELDEEYFAQPKAFLVEVLWGDIDQSLQPDVNTTDWSGTVGVRGGFVKAYDTIKFEVQQDELGPLAMLGKKAFSYSSQIKSHFDGIVLKVKVDDVDDFSLFLENDYAGKLALDLEDLREGALLEFDAGYKMLVRAYNPLEYKKRISKDPMLLLVRWGNLTGGLDNDASAVEYAGTIESNGVDIGLSSTVLFEEADSAESQDRTRINYSSNIKGHWDGVLVKAKPVYQSTDDIDSEDQDDLDVQNAAKERYIEVSIGGQVIKITSLDDLGLYDLQDGNQVEIVNIFDYANERFDAGVGRKVKMLSKCERISSFIKNWEDENPGENLSELHVLCEELIRYNLDGDTLQKVLDRLEKFINSVEEGELSRDEVLEKKNELEARWSGLKETAKVAKYNLGHIPFKDVDDAPDVWFYEFVYNMYQRGIINGYSDANGNPLGEYRPANSVTVAELLKIALLAAGEEKDGNIADLPENIRNHWGAAYFRRAEIMELSIVADLSSLDPNRMATRAEVVQLIIEAYSIDVPSTESGIYSDVPSTHPLVRYVNYATETGLVSGDSTANTFRPDDGVNRAELAKIINNALAVLGD